MSHLTPTAIGVIGSGPLGTGLATLLHQAGHDVVASSRTPGAQPVAGYPVTRFQAAAEDGQIVFLAVAHEALPTLLPQLAPALADKVVVDCTNPFSIVDGRITSSLPPGTTQGQWTAEMLPAATVVRAFSHIQDELLVSRARSQPGLWGAAVAGDDGPALSVIEALITQMGYVPVRIGTLRESHPLDPGGVLFPHLFLPQDMRDAVTPQHRQHAGA